MHLKIMDSMGMCLVPSPFNHELLPPLLSSRS
jgi:hypothetical protein